MDYDKTDMPATYSQARSLDAAVLDQWMDAVASQVTGNSIQTIVDLGCGTGRFEGALSKRFNATVLGLDPSWKMLQEARRETNPRVTHVNATGEEIPLRSSSVDLIFISMVFHHFADQDLAAHECARVLRSGGFLVLRTGTRDRISSYPYVPYFPGSRVLIEQRLPSLAAQCQTFENVALKKIYAGTLLQQIATDYSAYADKLALRADSILVSLDDEEFIKGVAAVRREGNRGPVVEPIDLAVFQKQKDMAPNA